MQACPLFRLQHSKGVQKFILICCHCLFQKFERFEPSAVCSRYAPLGLSACRNAGIPFISYQMVIRCRLKFDPTLQNHSAHRNAAPARRTAVTAIMLLANPLAIQLQKAATHATTADGILRFLRLRRLHALPGLLLLLRLPACWRTFLDLSIWLGIPSADSTSQTSLNWRQFVRHSKIIQIP